MKKQKVQLSNSLIRLSSTMRVSFLLFLTIAVGGFWLVDTLPANAAGVVGETSADYCKRVSEGLSSKLNACRDGILGKDCEDYEVTFDYATKKVCSDAATSGHSADTLNLTSNTGNPSDTPSDSNDINIPNGSSLDTNKNSQQDIQDQNGGLSDLIDSLHASGKDSKVDTTQQPDNNYGSYVNGAGQQQKIDVRESGIKDGPAIVFFNGGGWHSNDGTSDKVADGVADKGFGPATGGGALQRGYTVFNASYRYGSSGVYYQLEDVMRAIAHVRNNAGMYHIDPNKIAIFGDSAGGSLSMRANATGKSGAKAAVGWSPPTNAYTGLFKSYKSLLIGMDHSTCIPTDLAGLANTTDLLNGGSGDVAQYGQGLTSNSFDSLGDIGGNGGSFDAMSLLTQVLSGAQLMQQTSSNVESISSQLQSGGLMSMSGSLINMSAKKFTECLDNFNALSPALFASPDSSPAFVAGFDTDDVVGPEQVTGMRDKLRSLGIRSEAMLLQGNPAAAPNILGPTENHLGYDPRFVCATINFLDEIIQPDKGKVDCGTGAPAT